MPLVQLPPASDARTQGTTARHTPRYLMLARPDKADAGWLANALKALPKRRNVPDGIWQNLAPKLLEFYAQTFRRIRNGKLSLTTN